MPLLILLETYQQRLLGKSVVFFPPPSRGFQLGLLGPSWSALGALLGALGAVLGLSWAPLGALLGPLGAILGPSWAILGPLGALLGAILGPGRRSPAILNRTRRPYEKYTKTIGKPYLFALQAAQDGPS